MTIFSNEVCHFRGSLIEAERIDIREVKVGEYFVRNNQAVILERRNVPCAYFMGLANQEPHRRRRSRLRVPRIRISLSRVRARFLTFISL